MTHELHESIGSIVHAIEIFAILLMTVLILVGTARAAASMLRNEKAGYANYRVALGRAMLIGLELLVAADIVATVTAEPTLTNMATLGALVLVRTLLSWTIAVEVEGRWPWQGSPERRDAAEGEQPRAGSAHGG